MKPVRHLYGLSGHKGAWHSSLRSPAMDARVVTPEDAEALATLMLEAYRGTIDDGGETLADAQVEMHGFFDGKWQPAGGGSTQ